MKKRYLLFPLLALSLASSSQMTIQSGATLFIEGGAKVTIQGDLNSAANIQGSGTILMKGTGVQNITMNGGLIPNLEIDNAANVTLSGSAVRIGSSLLFTNGKLLTSSQDLILSPAATVSGQNVSRFIWTDGTGQVRKELTADISNFEIPVGFDGNYRPVYISSSSASYASAHIGVKCLGNASPNRPPMMANFLQTTWPATRSGITGGTQTITGQYVDPTDVTGTESTLVGYFFNGTDWSSAAEAHDAATNRVSMQMTAANGELTGMNKFIAVGSRAFLQGAYNAGTGLMSDALRTGGNVIPVNDPYRSAPYNTSFTHVANASPEMVSASVFNDQASVNDNIVDWVFLELRNTASPGNMVLQTRSALIQRDGDIVDIDGMSPVTFNNVTDGNYTIAVRHRNHIGLGTDNQTNSNWRTLTETKSASFAANAVDFRTESASRIFGSSYTNALHPTLGSVRVFYGGDASGNMVVRYTNPGNDKDAILSAIGGITTGSLLNVYRKEDINMNRQVRYTNPGNDKDFLVNVLGGTTTGSRSQILPN